MGRGLVLRAFASAFGSTLDIGMPRLTAIATTSRQLFAGCDSARPRRRVTHHGEAEVTRFIHGTSRLSNWCARRPADQARARGEVFGVRVKNAYHYPAGFAQLPTEDVKKVNRQLDGGDAAAKFIFWTRPHGGAGGKTIAALIAEGQVARAIELAQGWSAEHGACAGA